MRELVVVSATHLVTRGWIAQSFVRGFTTENTAKMSKFQE